MSRCDPRPCARAKLRLGKNKRAVAVAAGLLEHLTFQVAPCKAASVATRHQKEFTCSGLTTRSIASRFCGLPSAHTLTNSSRLEFRSPAASCSSSPSPKGTDGPGRRLPCSSSAFPTDGEPRGPQLYRRCGVWRSSACPRQRGEPRTAQRRGTCSAMSSCSAAANRRRNTNSGIGRSPALQ